MQKQKKAKQWSLLALSALLVGMLAAFFYLSNRYALAKPYSFSEVEKQNPKSTLQIGIIGDSWVADHNLDTYLQERLFDRGLENQVVSSGQHGARSKYIYLNLFKGNESPHSSQFILEAQVNYCIIIAGVNDASSQIGKSYYSYHILQIIQALLHHHIKPVLVNLPEFDVEETIERKNILSKTREHIAAKCNNEGRIDNILDYRGHLHAELSKHNLLHQIVLVDFNNVCSDYHQCHALYKDPSHLSALGEQKLCEVLAEEISEVYYRENRNHPCMISDLLQKMHYADIEPK